MNSRFKKILSQFETELNLIQVEVDDVLKQAEMSIQLCLSTIDKVRKTLLEHGCANEKEEAFFFKHIKPQFVSRLIYYVNIYNIETHRPNGLIKIRKKYFQLELNKIKNYFDDNLDFYRYYRTGSTYLDHKYFVRRKHDIRLNLDAYVYEIDPDFSTTHDFKISTILANDLLQVYLENEINKVDFQPVKKEPDLIHKDTLHWTASKVSLIELMYSLHQSGVFNNGQSDIKAIATCFENIFNVDLGNYYRTYLELKIRQDRTKFLDSLRENFIRKIEDEEK